MRLAFVITFLALLALTAPAAADSWSLDYRANDPSCITGSRFADEVSAKLGFVPWANTATGKIRIRIDREGGQFTGTFRHADGQAKIIDGATCAEVTSNLVITVAAAVDKSPAPRVQPAVAKTVASAPPSEPPLRLSGGIPVSFTSAEGRRIDISLNSSSGVGRASNGATVVAAYYDKLCTSPCTTQLPNGRHHLVFSDPDTHSLGGGRFIIDRPTSFSLAHRSRSGIRRGLFISGVALMALGVVSFAALDGTGRVALGVTGLSLGLPAAIAPLWVPDTFTVTQTP